MRILHLVVAVVSTVAFLVSAARVARSEEPVDPRPVTSSAAASSTAPPRGGR